MGPLLLLLPALAFSCSHPCTEPSVEAAFDKAALVFYGTVVERKDRGMYDLVVFDVNTLWKGAPVKSAMLSVESNTCDPMGDMSEAGEKFLVFATSPTLPNDKRTGDAGELVTGFCRGSTRFMPYDQGPPRHAELTALAAGKRPGTKPKGRKAPRRRGPKKN
ncbi:MAG: hypothetical protein HY925_11365 [Elusimicrobia bacterium]|nr:hypothetical protein [Elusimicrobiota bacterium]